MKRKYITLLLLFFALIANSQTAEDLFKASDVKIYWLGVDFSHVKLIGNFSQFSSAGQESSVQIRDKYFPVWNDLILRESDKYDIKGMLRKGEIIYDIDMIMDINSKTPIEEIESYNTPNYKLADIKKFIKKYKIKDKDGIGVLFIAESLNKNAKDAYYHFVAINLKTKEILIHERIRGEPVGIGLRNYWAGSVYSVIKSINKKYYKIWKRDFK